MKPDIGFDTCVALGLDPDHVARLSITMRPGNLTTVTAVLLVDLEGKRFVEHLANYRLTWAPPTGQPTPDPFGFLEE